MAAAGFYALIEPHYPKAGSRRPSVGVERTLRMYCVANWFNLCDEGCEDPHYDVAVFRDFCQFDFGQERAPDSTPLLNFRHPMEEHDLGVKLGQFGGDGRFAYTCVHRLNMSIRDR